MCSNIIHTLHPHTHTTQLGFNKRKRAIRNDAERARVCARPRKGGCGVQSSSKGRRNIVFKWNRPKIFIMRACCFLFFFFVLHYIIVMTTAEISLPPRVRAVISTRLLSTVPWSRARVILLLSRCRVSLDWNCIYTEFNYPAIYYTHHSNKLSQTRIILLAARTYNCSLTHERAWKTTESQVL